MPSRNKIETGSEQRTLQTREKNNPTIGYNANVQRDDRTHAAVDAGKLTPEEEKIYLDAQNRAMKHSRRNERQEEKFPSDPIDSESPVKRGPKNPHKS